MIKKFDDVYAGIISKKDIILKINELVDAVNSIVSVQEKLIDSRFVVETKHEEPADLFAEQRRWIGKLCRFWDTNYEDHIYRILHRIEPDDICLYKASDGFGGGYIHCEPVKPDDDIIYSGEQ